MIVANRLPVDRVQQPDGEVAWRRSPGGLVSALEPVMRANDGDILELADDRLILNPGSAGQPRDGDPRAAYMLYDDAANTVSWHRVEYDARAVLRKIIDAGLPDYLGQRLLVGR